MTRKGEPVVDSARLPRPYYEADGISLFNADCLDIIPSLTCDIAITDPPYNAKKKFGAGTNDNREWPDWVSWFDDRLTAMLAVSRQGAMSFLSQTAMRHYLRHGRNEVAWQGVWVKPLSMAVCAAPFMPHWEPLLYWGDQRRRRGDGVGWGSDVLTHNVEFGKSRRKHATPKPLALMIDLLERFPPDTVVLDPFAGSGTTLLAAQKLGMRAIGIEIEEAHCDTAAGLLTLGITRWKAQKRGQGSLL